jgi:hypothetical protein
MSKEILWWGYRHANGSLHVKRYFNDPLDLVEAQASPFVDSVCQPFPASSREEAM